MITHDVILAVVAVELLFAFSVGITCIIFSFNLLRAIKESAESEQLTLGQGDLPLFGGSAQRPSNLAQQEEVTLLESGTTVTSTAPTRMMSQGSEMDYEDPQVGSLGVYHTFVSYLRLW